MFHFLTSMELRSSLTSAFAFQLGFAKCSRIDNWTVKHTSLYFFFLRKEVIQPHLPIRLPCYDFTPVISPAFSSFRFWITDFGHYQLPWCDGRCVQDPGTYSPRHSDSRLLAIPASCSRVADCNPNWDVIFGICSHSHVRFPLFTPL